MFLFKEDFSFIQNFHKLCPQSYNYFSKLNT
jgi:hypothetical protein